MAGRGAVPESLLEELSLADGEFGTLGQSTRSGGADYRLERSHLSVPIEKILEDSPYQSRIVTFDPERFSKDAELLESVKLYGVLEPIYLESLPTGLGVAGSYRPIAGHRRLAAAKLAGLQSIDAIIAKAEDDVQAFALAENLGHRELTPYEKALSLIALKGNNPRLSLKDLSERSGLPLGTVSSLISAYEKGSPILRRCFAEGMAPRTVQELQPSFESLDEKVQMKLVTILNKASQAQATSFRQMIESGIEPLAAAQSVMGFQKNDSGEPGHSNMRSQEKSLTKKSNHAWKRRPSKAKKNAGKLGLPGLEGESALSALASRTGTSTSVVRRLVKQTQHKELDYTSLTLACVYESRGGDRSQSMELASLAAGDRSIVSVVRRHLDVLERARNLIANEDAPEISGFLQTIFFDACVRCEACPQ